MKIRKLLMISLFLLAAFITAGGVFLQQEKFGRRPSGERLKRIEQSPNYRNGSFQNQLSTPMMTENGGYMGALRDFMFRKSPRSTPVSTMPSQKVDLFSLPAHDDVIVWFGHSSYFMQIDGKRFLVDPVLSGNASPLPMTGSSFAGTDVYAPSEIPEIDYLLITHDHWDHLDYETVTALKPKIRRVVTGLGVGSHLEAWGFDPARIIERDWNETVVFEDGVTITLTPARHFSGRSIVRNNTLWTSMVVKTPHRAVFVSGDGGYGPHFTEIGARFGPFDMALVECGQYNEHWKYIHMSPEETAKAAADLRAKAFIPVHWGKFVLSLHAWDDPIIRVTNEARRMRIPVHTPMIGQPVKLDEAPSKGRWWDGLN